MASVIVYTLGINHPKTVMAAYIFLQVGSRRVILWGGLIMMLVGVFNKIGALFVSIPDPIIGGVFMISFGNNLLITNHLFYDVTLHDYRELGAT